MNVENPRLMRGSDLKFKNRAHHTRVNALNASERTDYIVGKPPKRKGKFESTETITQIILIMNHSNGTQQNDWL